MCSSPDADVSPEAQTRIRQQEVVAELGQQALAADDLDQLMHDAAAAVAETLDNECAKVLDLLPGGDELLLRQGVGWRDGLVGNGTVPTDRDSQAGFTLISERPVIVDDLRTEERFSGPDLLVDHDVVSGISVVIGSVEDPWGVLGTHTSERREFTKHDANFVQSVANVLAAAIEQATTTRELREREAELGKTFDRITDAFIGLDRDWEITYVNDRGEELLDPENRGLVGENFWDPFEPALETTFETEYHEAMETQEPTHFEEYYPPLGVWFEVHAYPSESGLSIYFRDVTERKKRERKLKESEQRYRTLAENFPNGIVTMFDTDLRYTLAAGQAFDEFPISADDAEGKPVENVWPEQTSDVLQPAFRAALNGEKQVVEVEYLDREWIVHVVPVSDPDGTIFGGLTIAQDITERKEYEQALEESEHRYRTLVENFPNGVVGLFDENMEYTAVGGQLLDEIDVSREERIGECVSDLYPDDLVEEVEPYFEAALDGETNSFEVEFYDRHLMAHSLPVRNVEGETYAGMMMVQDVTERREYQRKLEESNERLEQFAYAASHDLQEPLRMVSSYLSLIESRYSDELDQDGEEFLEFAVDGAERMRAMIEGLLEYSRVDTQGNPFEPVDLSQLVEDVQGDLQMRVEESDARISIDDLPLVEGDESQLRQVFQNLLTNAITYSGDEPPEIHVEADRRGEQWVLSIHDAGIGIPLDDQDRVFDVFQRLHSHDEYSGTGIGLALCQRIVERHGGQIWVDSEPGEGTTFSFTLPAADE